MKEELVSFQVAKLAKEKKFNIHCRWYFDDKDGTLCENEDFPYNSWNDSLFAPTQSLLQKWLREVHDLHCSVYRMNNQWVSQVFDITNNKYINPHCYHNSYEEALETGLQEALKLIKDETKKQ